MPEAALPVPRLDRAITLFFRGDSQGVATAAAYEETQAGREGRQRSFVFRYDPRFNLDTRITDEDNHGWKVASWEPLGRRRFIQALCDWSPPGDSRRLS